MKSKKRAKSRPCIFYFFTVFVKHILYVHICLVLKNPHTFFEEAECLTTGEDALDVDADGSLGGVLAPHHGEAQALVAGTLQEAHILYPVQLALSLAWQGAELGVI